MKVRLTFAQLIEAFGKFKGHPVRDGVVFLDNEQPDFTGTVTIEIPDEEPEPFRVRTARELHELYLSDAVPVETLAVKVGAQERTRDLAKLLREQARQTHPTVRPSVALENAAHDFDAIADKDGE